MYEAADSVFNEHLKQGRFMIQRSASSGKYVFPPRIMLPGDGRSDLEWVEASGQGTVHSFTVIPQRSPQTDYNVCLIDLEEGPRMMATVVEISNEEIAIGLVVAARIVSTEDEPYIVFGPEG